MEIYCDRKDHNTDDMDLLYDDVLGSDKNHEGQTSSEEMDDVSSKPEDTETSNLDETFDMYGDLTTDQYGSSFTVTESNTGQDTTLENAVEDMDLYDDILTEEDTEQKQSYDQKCEQYESAMKLIVKLEAENMKLKENLMKQTAVSGNVQKNMSSLLVTARAELTRKDKEIARLRNRHNLKPRSKEIGLPADRDRDTQKKERGSRLRRSLTEKETGQATTSDERKSKYTNKTKSNEDPNETEEAENCRPRKGESSKAGSSKYEKDVFGRARIKETERSGKESRKRSREKDRSHRNKANEMKPDYIPDAHVSSKQKKHPEKFVSQNENEKHDRHNENKKVDVKEESGHERKDERSERRIEDVEKRRNDDDRQKKKAEIVKEPQESDRNFGKDKSSKNSDSDDLNVCSSGNKVLDLREKLRIKRALMESKSEPVKSKESIVVTSSETNNSNITISDIPRLHNKKSLFKALNAIDSKPKVCNGKENLNLSKDKEFLESLKCTVKQNKLVKETPDSDMDKNQIMCVQEKPVMVNSSSDVKTISKQKRDVVDYNDFSPCTNPSLLEDMNDIVERDFRKNTECHPKISNGFVCDDKSVRKETTPDDSVHQQSKTTSDSSNSVTEKPEPSRAPVVAQEASNLSNQESNYSSGGNIPLPKDGNEESKVKDTAVEGHNKKGQENVLNVEELTNQVNCNSTQESKSDEIFSPPNRSENNGKAEKRRSSEKKRKPSYRRVISETISSVTSCIESPSVEEFLEKLKKECENKSTDCTIKANTTDTLSNLDHEADKIVSNASHEKVVVTPTETIKIKSTSVVEGTAKKRYCSKEGCSIKVNHLHPKSSSPKSEVQTSSPKDGSMKSSIDTDIITSKAYNISIDKQTASTEGLCHLEGTSDLQTDIHPTSVEMSRKGRESGKKEKGSSRSEERIKSHNVNQENVTDKGPGDLSCNNKFSDSSAYKSDTLDRDTYVSINHGDKLKTSEERKNKLSQDRKIEDSKGNDKVSSDDASNRKHAANKPSPGSSDDSSSSDSEEDSSYTSSGSGSSSSSSSDSSEGETSGVSDCEEVIQSETPVGGSSVKQLVGTEAVMKGEIFEENMDMQDTRKSKIQVKTSSEFKNTEGTKISEKDTEHQCVKADTSDSSSKMVTENTQRKVDSVVQKVEGSHTDLSYKYTGLKQKEGDTVMEVNPDNVSPTVEEKEHFETEKSCNTPIKSSKVVPPNENSSVQAKSFLLESLLCGIASVVNQKKEDEQYLKKSLEGAFKDKTGTAGICQSDPMKSNSTETNSMKSVTDTFSENISVTTGGIGHPSKTRTDTGAEDKLSKNVSGESKISDRKMSDQQTDKNKNSNINNLMCKQSPLTSVDVEGGEEPSKDANQTAPDDQEGLQGYTTEASIFGSTLSLSSDDSGSSGSSSSGSESDSDSSSESSSDSESSSYTTDSSSSDEGNTIVENRSSKLSVINNVDLNSKTKKNENTASESTPVSLETLTKDTNNKTVEHKTTNAVKVSGKKVDSKSDFFNKIGDKKTGQLESDILKNSECGRKTLFPKTKKDTTNEQNIPKDSNNQEDNSSCENTFMIEDESPKFLCETPAVRPEKPARKRQKASSKGLPFVQSSPMITIENNKVAAITEISDPRAKTADEELATSELSKSKNSEKASDQNVQHNSKKASEKTNARKENVFKVDDVFKVKTRSLNEEQEQSDTMKSSDKSKKSKEKIQKSLIDTEESTESSKEVQKRKEMTLRLVGLSSATKSTNITSTAISAEIDIEKSKQESDKERQKTKTQPKCPVVASKSDKSVTGSILRLVSKSNERLKDKCTTNKGKSKLASPKKKRNELKLRGNDMNHGSFVPRTKLKFEHKALPKHRDPATELTENLSKIAAYNDRVKENKKTINDSKHKAKDTGKSQSEANNSVLRNKRKKIIICSESESDDAIHTKSKPLPTESHLTANSSRKKLRILSDSEEDIKAPTLTVKSSSVPQTLNTVTLGLSSDTEDYDLNELKGEVKAPCENNNRSNTTKNDDKRNNQVHQDKKLTHDTTKAAGKTNSSIKVLKSFDDIIENYERHLVKTIKTRKFSKVDKPKKQTLEKPCPLKIPETGNTCQSVRGDKVTVPTRKSPRKSNRSERLSPPLKVGKIHHSESKNVKKQQEERHKNVNRSVNEDSSTGKSKAIKATSKHNGNKDNISGNKPHSSRTETKIHLKLTKETDSETSDSDSEDTDSIVRAIFGSSGSSGGKKPKPKNSSESGKCSSGEQRTISPKPATSSKENDVTMNLEEKLKQLYAGTRLARENMPKESSNEKSTDQTIQHNSKKRSDKTNATKESDVCKVKTQSVKVESNKAHKDDKKDSNSRKDFSSVLKSLSPKENQKSGHSSNAMITVTEQKDGSENIMENKTKTVADFILDDGDTQDCIDYEDDISLGFDDMSAFDRSPSNDETETVVEAGVLTEKPAFEAYGESPEDGEVSSDNDSAGCDLRSSSQKNGHTMSTKDEGYPTRKQADSESTEKKQHSRHDVLQNLYKSYSPIKFPGRRDSTRSTEGRNPGRRGSEVERTRYRSESLSSVEDVETFGVPSRKRASEKKKNKTDGNDSELKETRKSPPIRRRRSRSPNDTVKRKVQSQKSYSPRRSSSISPQRKKTSAQDGASLRTERRRSRSRSVERSMNTQRKTRERQSDRHSRKTWSSSEDDTHSDRPSRSNRRSDRKGHRVNKRRRSDSMSSCCDSPQDVLKHRRRRRSLSDERRYSTDSQKYRQRSSSKRKGSSRKDLRQEISRRSHKEVSFSKDRPSSHRHSGHKRRYMSSSDDEYVLVKKTELKRRRSVRSVTPTFSDTECSEDNKRVPKEIMRKKNSSEKENVTTPVVQKRRGSSHKTLKDRIR